MKNLLHLAIGILLLISGCTEKKTIEHPHYKLDLSLNPVNQKIAVQGSLKLPVKQDSRDHLTFYLHKELNLSNLEINGNDQFVLQKDSSDIRYMTEAVKYTLKTKEKLPHLATLTFQYSGKITQYPEWNASVIGEEWTEMALYFPWYPYLHQQTLLTYQVEVAPIKDYNVFIMGHEKKSGDSVTYTSLYPTNDIVVCAAKNLEKVTRNLSDFDFTLVHTTLSDTLIDTLSTDIKEILTTFNQWFSGSNTSICLVESLRERGGGYARLGGMYLNGLNQTSYFKKRKGYTRYLSHEIAHLWWHRANTNSWQDWLNEGFAEYSALMVLREQYGPVYFDKWLDLKKKKIKDTEPVWHCDRNGKNAYAILYSKAPVLLNKLEQKIGQKKFKKLMKGMLRNQISTTAEFLNLLEKQQGSETKKWFTTELKSF